MFGMPTKPFSDSDFDLLDRQYIDPSLPAELQQMRSPTGAARSTISDENGLVSFPLLTLMDSVNGTCFKMRFAFSPASEFEVITIAQLGVEYQEPVVAESRVVFCAVNKRTYSVTEEPSLVVAPDVVVANAPRITIEQPLEPYQLVADGPVRYYIPFGNLMGVHLMQLQPTMLGNYHLPLWARTLVGDFMLRGNLCLIRGTQELFNQCNASAPTSGVDVLRMFLWQDSMGKIMNGYPDIAQSHSKQVWPTFSGTYMSSTEGEAPTIALTWQFPHLALRAIPGLNSAAVLGVTGGNIEETDETATFQAMSLMSQPASIVILTVPPLLVRVGHPFLAKVEVQISSGSPLSGVRIAAGVVPTTGQVISGEKYITSQYGGQPRSAQNDAPALDNSTAFAVSNQAGVARFLLLLQAGTPGLSRSLVFTVASGTGNFIKSDPTRGFIIQNPVAYLTMSDIVIDRTGSNGIGNPDTYDVQVLRKPIESFPTFLDLLDVWVELELNTEQREDMEGDDTSWILSTLKIEVFSTEELLEAAEDAAAAGALADMAADAINQTAVNAFETTSSATGTSSAVNDAVSVFSRFLKLMVSGSAPLTGPATAPGGRYASIEPSFTLTPIDREDDSESLQSSKLSVRISNLRMLVRRAGEFKLQVKAAGIASPLTGDVKVKKYSADTFTKVVIKKIFQFASVAIATLMALGNSDWHDPRIGVPISFTFVGILMWGTVNEFGDTFSSVDGVGVWYMVAYSLIAVFTLVGLAGWRAGTRWPSIRSFADVRRERYFAYVHRLLHAPSFESGLLRRELEERSLKAQGLSLKPWHDQSQKVLPFPLRDRMILEAQIKQAIERERSYKAQAQEILRSMLHDDRDAFHFPTR